MNNKEKFMKYVLKRIEQKIEKQKKLERDIAYVQARAIVRCSRGRYKIGQL